MPYNLRCPNTILEAVDVSDINGWYARETLQVKSDAVRHVLQHVGNHLADFVEWPKRSFLLWRGCDRVPLAGKKQKYHVYPDTIRQLAKARKLTLDSRPNGPARASFSLSDGVRPGRFGSTNASTMHHLYSGKFPYLGRVSTLHAVKKGDHFTQSAGVIATHPIADALSDEYPFFAWRLRFEAFTRFGYDPDGVFSSAQNELGFACGDKQEVFFQDIDSV
jgi:hypothetical protein